MTTALEISYIFNKIFSAIWICQLVFVAEEYAYLTLQTNYFFLNFEIFEWTIIGRDNSLMTQNYYLKRFEITLSPILKFLP